MVGILLILCACFMWAGDTLIRYPLVERGLNPISIVAFEHCILVLLFGVRLIKRLGSISSLRLGDLFAFFMVGGMGSAVATVAFTESFQILNPSLVILLQKFQPLVAILLARLVLGENLAKPFLFWTAFCLLGGVLISWPDLMRLWQLWQMNPSKVTSEAALHGYALVGISVLGWGAATTFGKRLTESGFDTSTIMGGRFVVGLLCLLPFVPWHKQWYFTEPLDYVRIGVMVLISGMMAMWFYYRGLAKISAKTCAILEMFFPFFAVIVNWVFLGKQLSDIQLLGGGILGFGALVIQLKKY